MTDFVFDIIGGMVIVLIILGSLAGIVEGYLESKEKDMRRKLKDKRSD